MRAVVGLTEDDAGDASVAHVLTPTASTAIFTSAALLEVTVYGRSTLRGRPTKEEPGLSTLENMATDGHNTAGAKSSQFSVDDDWEEYDASKGPFAVHMIAGSCAGVAEHGIVYPIDTMKTYLQVRSDNNAHKNLAGRSALKNVIATEGITRMYRGILAVFAGVIPAHSAFFSVYELSKEKFGANLQGHHPFAAAASGACATVAHDLFKHLWTSSNRGYN